MDEKVAEVNRVCEIYEKWIPHAYLFESLTEILLDANRTVRIYSTEEIVDGQSMLLDQIEKQTRKS